MRLPVKQLFYIILKNNSSPYRGKRFCPYFRGERPLTHGSTTICPFLIAAVSVRTCDSNPSGGRERQYAIRNCTGASDSEQTTAFSLSGYPASTMPRQTPHSMISPPPIISSPGSISRL